MSKNIPVGVWYLDNFLDEFYVTEEEAAALKERLTDETVETFFAADQEFAKKDAAGVNVGGNWAAQFFAPSLLEG